MGKKEKRTVCNLLNEVIEIISAETLSKPKTERELMKLLEKIRNGTTAMENRLFKYRYAIAGLGFRRVEK